MNKLLLPLMLLTLTSNYSNMSLVNQTSSSPVRTITSIGENDLEGLIPTTLEELGLPYNKYTRPNYNDYQNKQTFEYMGYKYTNEDGTFTKDGYASDVDTIETVFVGTFSNAPTMNGDNIVTSFTNCKTLIDVTNLPTGLSTLTKLETVIFGDTINFTDLFPSSVKYFFFSQDPRQISGILDIPKNAKVIAPSSIAINVKKKMDVQYTNKGWKEGRELYVIPDEELPFQGNTFRPCYEIGGAYFTSSKLNRNEYGISYIASNVKKAMIDLTLLDDKSYSIQYGERASFFEKTDLEELYYKYSASCSYDLFSPFNIDKLYLGSITSSLTATNFTKCKEVYFPDNVTSGYTSISMNSGQSIKETTFYFPENLKESSVYSNLITQLDNTPGSKYYYYDSTSYQPTLEIEIDGERNSTMDMNVSYHDLVEQTINSSIEEIASQQEVNKVIALINSLGEITLETKDKINEAKIAYDNLTYNQQKLITNKETLSEAITSYNTLVEEYNKTITNEEEKLETIEQLKDKTKIDQMVETIKSNKLYTALTFTLGSLLGISFIYLLYKMISKFIKWLKRL